MTVTREYDVASFFHFQTSNVVAMCIFNEAGTQFNRTSAPASERLQISSENTRVRK